MGQMRNVRDVGLMIRSARKEAGMTQLELSQRANVSRRWLIGIETGTIEGPDASKLFDVIRALGLSFSLGPRPPSPAVTNQAAADALRLMDEKY